MFVTVKLIFSALLLSCVLPVSSFENIPTKEDAPIKEEDFIYKERQLGRKGALIGGLAGFFFSTSGRLLFVLTGALVGFCLGENWETTKRKQFYEKLENAQQQALKIKELELAAMKEESIKKWQQQNGLLAYYEQ